MFRLEDLKKSRYLSNKLFPRISENLHYEILKYSTSTTLLEVKTTNLGGYQATSNKLLRSRIKNYSPPFKPILHLNKSTEWNITLIKCMFTQTGSTQISFKKMKIGNEEINFFANMISKSEQISGINLCSNLYEYIYIYI